MKKLIKQLQDENHTGRNRCIKCTVFNIILSIVLSVVLFVILLVEFTGAQSVAVAGIFLLLSFTTIWLKGYFVPYTPQITRKFFPQRVLHWFGKENPSSPIRSFDPSSHVPSLETANVLVYSDDHEDYVVSDDIIANISERYSKDSPEVDNLLEQVGIEDVAVLDRGKKIYLISDDERIHYWPSEKALAIDAILVDILEESVITWKMRPPEERLNLLATVRLFFQQCPDGEHTIGKVSEYETCCDEKVVFKTVCEESDDVLFSRGADNI